jgi:hypothetical protein
MDGARCTHRAPHAARRERMRRVGGVPAVVHPRRGRLEPGSRPALESDPPCPCGRPALVIFTTTEFGDVVWCGA